jgi:hypothetical protein
MAEEETKPDLTGADLRFIEYKEGARNLEKSRLDPQQLAQNKRHVIRIAEILKGSDAINALHQRLKNKTQDIDQRKNNIDQLPTEMQMFYLEGYKAGLHYTVDFIEKLVLNAEEYKKEVL